MVFVTVKKTILFLYPDKFTNFEYYKFEFSQLKKKYKFNIIINDLSNLIHNQRLNLIWKSKRYKKAILFSSIKDWIFFFNKIKKKNIIIFNFASQNYSLNSLIIKIFLKLSKKTVFIDRQSNHEIPVKKNISWLLSKFYEHGFNYKVYFFYFRDYFFRFLMSFVKYEKSFVLLSDYVSKINNKKNSIININQTDYSNYLLFKKNKKKNKKKYILYLDNGGPFFTGDAELTGHKSSTNSWSRINMDSYFKNLMFFFKKLEKHFKANIIVIPHPKYKSSNKKIKSFNPYFKNNIVNNDVDALSKLSRNALFFITEYTTAVAFAVACYKPVVCITSSKHNFSENNKKAIMDQDKNLGITPFDISNFNIKKINKILKINKSKYENYKYKHLTTKKENVERKPNYKIIGDFIRDNV